MFLMSGLQGLEYNRSTPHWDINEPHHSKTCLLAFEYSARKRLEVSCAKTAQNIFNISPKI